MQRIYSLSPFRLVMLFWVIAIALYGIAWRSGFERDFHGWFQIYTNLSFWDCMNRKGSGITSLYQVTQVQLWVWSWLFGPRPLPWFLLLTGLHAAAAAAMVTFGRNVYTDFKWKRAEPLPFGAGFSF